MIQKIYKNTDLLFTISIGDNDNIINIADISELNITFYTDTTNVENHIVVTKDDIINDNQIFIDNSKLNLLNEGLLKYNIKLRFNNTSINEPFDIAKTVETEYFIKNDNYNDSTCTGGTTDSYSKSEIDLKLSLKANSSDVYSKAETNERLAEKANKSDLPDISTMATKDELKLKANTNDVYSKVEVDAKIDDAVTGEIDLSDYYKKVEIDSKLSEKADISAIAELATKTELAGKADAADVYMKSQTYSKSEVNDLIDSIETSGSTVDLTNYYKKDEVNALLTNKADTSAIADMATKTELAGKANSSDVYNKNQTYNRAEIDEKIASAGTTGGTVTSSEVYILRWDEVQATEERAALYTKLYESFWYNNTVSVLFNVINGTDEYIIDVNNIYKDNSATRNEIKMYGSCILSSSIFHVEIVLKKDGSFTFTKNNIAINKLNTMQLEKRIETLESEIKNPTEMKVDCLNYE